MNISNELDEELPSPRSYSTSYISKHTPIPPSVLEYMKHASETSSSLSKCKPPLLLSHLANKKSDW